MEVNGDLTFITTSQVETLTLRLAKSFGQPGITVLEPHEVAGKLLLLNKKENGNAAEYTFKLGGPVAANRTCRISFSYAGGATPLFTFYLGPEVSFANGPLVPWYPEIAGRDERGIGELTFELPDGYQTVASGKRLNFSKPGTASFRVSVPEHFSFSCAPYRVIRREGKVPVTIYYLHQRQNINAYIDGIVRALNYLITEFGPYPYEDFAMAEIPDEQASGFGGASTSGLLFATSGSLDAPFNLAYFGHELSHQWWGNLVTVEGESGAFMLSEGIAQYGSLRVVENISGSRSADEYRKTGYPGYDPNHDALGYFKFAAAEMDHRLDTLSGKTPTLSHELADTKGFLVLDLLARTIEYKNFRQVLQNLTRDYAFQSLTWNDFLAAVQRESRDNLHWFFEQWFERTGAPDWNLEWKQIGTSLEIVITQKAPYYRAAVPIEVYEGECPRLSQTVRIAGPKTSLRLKVHFSAERVVLDPHLLVLHWTPAFRDEASALRYAFKANFERIQGNVEEARQQFETARSKVTQPDRYGAVFAIEEGLARVSISQRNWLEAKQHLMAALATPQRNSNTLPWVFYRLATVAQHLGDPELSGWAINGAIASDALLDAPTGAGEAARKIIPKP